MDTSRGASRALHIHVVWRCEAFVHSDLSALRKLLWHRLGDELANDLSTGLLEVPRQTLQRLPGRLITPPHEALAYARESSEQPSRSPRLGPSPAPPLPRRP